MCASRLTPLGLVCARDFGKGLLATCHLYGVQNAEVVGGLGVLRCCVQLLFQLGDFCLLLGDVRLELSYLRVLVVAAASTIAVTAFVSFLCAITFAVPLLRWTDLGNNAVAHDNRCAIGHHELAIG